MPSPEFLINLKDKIMRSCYCAEYEMLILGKGFPSLKTLSTNNGFERSDCEDRKPWLENLLRKPQTSLYLKLAKG